MKSDNSETEKTTISGARSDEATCSVCCENCNFWKVVDDEYDDTLNPDFNPATLEDWKDDAERKLFMPHEVGRCKSPKMKFYQCPEEDGAAMFDGSQYHASLATGPKFGCVNFLPNV